MTQPAAPALYRPGGDIGGFVSRWIRIWVVVLAVVTLVAVIFLILISQTLASINGHLETARDAVRDVGGETKTLPRQVGNVNNSLKDIDDDVKPIQSGAQKIVASLRGIQGKLSNVDRSLAGTSGVLTGVGGQVPDVRNTLAAAQATGSQGTNLIWRQIQGATNPTLDAIRSDSGNAIRQLDSINRGLSQICAATNFLSPQC